MVIFEGLPPPGLLLTITGLISGFVDSIAGGGGLINIPILTLLIGPGPDTIGTNKIPGAVAALVALVVYARSGHMDVKRSLAFTLWVGFGSLLGSSTAPHLPISAFRWILLVTCPVILWVVWNKELWVTETLTAPWNSRQSTLFGNSGLKIAVAGVLCGFYDGVWGPGGGTFMFLSLLFLARLPLLVAITASKLANTCSATVALTNYALHGHVHWVEGSFLASGIAIGAFFGARYATRNAAQIVRPILVVVVALLILKLI